MVLMAPLPSLEAEQARFLANELRGTGRLRARGRSRVASRLRAQQSRLLIELAQPRAIAIGENYLLVSATRVIKPVLLTATPPPNPPDADTKRLRSCANSFPLLVSLWWSDFGVDLTAVPGWSDFEELRDLRHVLVHRLGRWEPGIDRPHPKLDARLRRVAANPDAYRGEVPLVASDLYRTIVAVLAVVDEADRRLP